MALIKLHVAVNSLDEVLKRYDQVKVYRSTTGVTGTYSEITTADTRIKLLAGQALYTFHDAAGDRTYWYKTAYFNSGDSSESSQSDPTLGDDAEVLTGILTIQELKDTFLYGLDLTDDRGNEYPDIMFEFGIRAAIQWVEKQLDLFIRPTSRVERHDFNLRDYQEWMFIQLDKYPAISCEKVEIIWPSSSEKISFPTEWISLQADLGQINLVPTHGTLAQALMVLSGAWLPALIGGMSFIPNAVSVEYTAGFPFGALPYDIKEMIGMRATNPILNTAGDLIAGAGIANYSISMDGISQTIGTTACLAGSTLVDAPGGQVAIAELHRRVQAGEVVEVYGLNERTGKRRVQEVIASFDSGKKQTHELRIGNGGVVRMTKDHRCLTGSGWRTMGELNRGTLLIDGKGMSAPVESVGPGEMEQTFDLEIEAPWHNFSVANSSMILHNSATNAGYGARILNYEKHIKAQLPVLRKFYKRVGLAVG